MAKHAPIFRCTDHILRNTFYHTDVPFCNLSSSVRKVSYIDNRNDPHLCWHDTCECKCVHNRDEHCKVENSGLYSGHPHNGLWLNVHTVVKETLSGRGTFLVMEWCGMASPMNGHIPVSSSLRSNKDRNVGNIFSYMGVRHHITSSRIVFHI